MSKMFEGALEYVGRDGVVGWAFDPASEVPLDICVLIDGETLATITCDRPRDDVLDAFGRLMAGFRLDLPEYLHDGEEHEVSFTRSDGVHLPLPALMGPRFRLGPAAAPLAESPVVVSAQDIAKIIGDAIEGAAALDVPAPPDFDEAAYLRMYPDVGEAIEAGKYRSPFAHYIRHGRHEGRRRATRAQA